MGLTKLQREALKFLSEGGAFIFNRSLTFWNITDVRFDGRVMSGLNRKQLLTVKYTALSQDGNRHELWVYGLSQLGKAELGQEVDHSNKVAGTITGRIPAPVPKIHRNFCQRVMGTLQSLEATENMTEAEVLALRIARAALRQMKPLAFRVAVQAAKEEL